MLHVHLLHPPDENDRPTFLARLDDRIQLSIGPDGILPNTEILVGGRPTREQIVACGPSLRAIVVPFAGVPDVTRVVIAEFPHLAVHNLHHNAAPTTETAIALLLAAAKFIVPIDQRFRAGSWGPRYEDNPAVTLAGQTALILGWGAIGQRVAQVCHALAMTVLATKRTRPFGKVGDFEIHPPTDLHELLPRANAVINCLPLTNATRGLIGADELTMLPPYAVVVNVGRAATMDEAALYTALTNGTVYAAGLDVWYAYPPDEQTLDTPPSQYPFHQLANVVMSPHRAGKSHDIEAIRLAGLADLLNVAARGDPMPNQVDLAAGY